MDRNTFNQINQQKKGPWPIRLALKYGAKDTQQAAQIVLGIIAVLLVITAIMYIRLFSEPAVQEISPAELAEMETLSGL